MANTTQVFEPQSIVILDSRSVLTRIGYVTGNRSVLSEPTSTPVVHCPLCGQPRTQQSLERLDRLSLTVRQREVIELALLGLRPASVARILLIEPTTVRNHLARIYRKVGVHTHGELVEWALELATSHEPIL